MTWQLGAFTILALALAAGFAWYERRKPDARIVALVGTMAAFAALGRIAFAALPNVKPSTDIILISGYALGGAPGFAIGALTGLTSNFFFGQGPWTPWQMAGWGATGALGATLAVLTRGHIRRLPLALVCAAVGFAFTALQDFGDWVTYSDHSFAQLAVYVGKGVGFDFVHAAGCLVFALAFGPALLRSLRRFADRLQVTWGPPAGAALPTVLALVAAAGALGAAALQPTPVRAATTPAGYLLAAQNSDGGFGAAPGQPSSPLYAGWAALGLEADGISPGNVGRGGATLLDYVTATAGEGTDPGSLERTILVVEGAALSATDVNGKNLVAALQSHIGPHGAVAGQVNLTAFAVLALRAAGAPVPQAMVAWLIRQHDGDGGFSFASAGGGSDVDDTGAALQALAGASGSRVGWVRARAIAFIRSVQNPDGGFPSLPGGYSNAQSTAWAIQGLVAAGVDPNALHLHGAPSPLAYLRSLQAPDGHVRYARGSDQTPVWVTGEALLALAGKPLPLAPVPAAQPTTGQSKPSTAVHSAHRTTASRRHARRSATHHAARRRSHARRRPSAVSSPPPSAVTTVQRLASLGLATVLAFAGVGVR